MRITDAAQIDSRVGDILREWLSGQSVQVFHFPAAYDRGSLDTQSPKAVGSAAQVLTVSKSGLARGRRRWSRCQWWPDDAVHQRHQPPSHSDSPVSGGLIGRSADHGFLRCTGGLVAPFRGIKTHHMLVEAFRAVDSALMLQAREGVHRHPCLRDSEVWRGQAEGLQPRPSSLPSSEKSGRDSTLETFGFRLSAHPFPRSVSHFAWLVRTIAFSANRFAASNAECLVASLAA